MHEIIDNKVYIVAINWNLNVCFKCQFEIFGEITRNLYCDVRLSVLYGDNSFVANVMLVGSVLLFIFENLNKN